MKLVQNVAISKQKRLFFYTFHSIEHQLRLNSQVYYLTSDLTAQENNKHAGHVKLTHQNRIIVKCFCTPARLPVSESHEGSPGHLQCWLM